VGSTSTLQNILFASSLLLYLTCINGGSLRKKGVVAIDIRTKRRRLYVDLVTIVKYCLHVCIQNLVR
jgi:hypothetical protein